MRRLSAQRCKPLGDEGWVGSIARRLSLESTMRRRARPVEDGPGRRDDYENMLPDA
jgi:hypothetical protein